MPHMPVAAFPTLLVFDKIQVQHRIDPKIPLLERLFLFCARMPFPFCLSVWWRETEFFCIVYFLIHDISLCVWWSFWRKGGGGGGILRVHQCFCAGGEYHQSLQEEHQEQLLMMIKKNQRERERECSLEKILGTNFSSTTEKLKLLC